MEDVVNLRAAKYYEKLNSLNEYQNYMKFSNCTSMELYLWKKPLQETMTKLSKLKEDPSKNESTFLTTQVTGSQKSMSGNIP